MGEQVDAGSLLKTGFTSDQRIERKFSFLMTDKASVKDMYLENCIYEKQSKNVKRLEIGKRDIRGVIFKG